MDELEIQSYHELSRRAGLSHGTINTQKNHLKPLTVQVAEGLCQALRVDWVELWTHAGYSQEVNPTPEALKVALVQAAKKPGHMQRKILSR